MQSDIDAQLTNFFEEAPPREFATVMRGYDRHQVDEHIRQIEAEVRQHREQSQTMRRELSDAQRQIQEQERQLKVITEDQVRLRANLKEMPATAAAYKRYLEKFDLQETQIEDYQKQVKSLQGVEHNQRKEFEDFLANFSAE